MFIRKCHRRATVGERLSASSFPTRVSPAPVKKKVGEGDLASSMLAARLGELPGGRQLGGEVEKEAEGGALLCRPSGTA